MTSTYKQIWDELIENLTVTQKNEPGRFREICNIFYNKICAPDRVIHAGDVMLYYLQHAKKLSNMSPRDFSLRWNEMLRHTEILEKHYEEELDKVKRKLMYMGTYLRAYHQKFISPGKNFDQMSEEDITKYFQILHREEEETKPQGTSKAEGDVRGT